jgi:hypothetical protein
MHAQLVHAIPMFRGPHMHDFSISPVPGHVRPDNIGWTHGRTTHCPALETSWNGKFEGSRDIWLNRRT